MKLELFQLQMHRKPISKSIFQKEGREEERKERKDKRRKEARKQAAV